MRQEEIIAKSSICEKAHEYWDILILSKGSLEHKISALEKPEEDLTVLEENTAQLRGRRNKKQKEEKLDNRTRDEEDKKERNVNIKRGKQSLEGCHNIEGLFLVVSNPGSELTKEIVRHRKVLLLP